MTEARRPVELHIETLVLPQLNGLHIPTVKATLEAELARQLEGWQPAADAGQERALSPRVTMTPGMSSYELGRALAHALAHALTHPPRQESDL